MTDNGGCAFPRPGEAGIHEGCPGMSMRDYFAAAALTGIMCAPIGKLKDMAKREVGSEHQIAEIAWAVADAMIAKRDER